MLVSVPPPAPHPPLSIHAAAPPVHEEVQLLTHLWNCVSSQVPPELKYRWKLEVPLISTLSFHLHPVDGVSSKTSSWMAIKTTEAALKSHFK